MLAVVIPCAALTTAAMPAPSVMACVSALEVRGREDQPGVMCLFPRLNGPIDAVAQRVSKKPFVVAVDPASQDRASGTRWGIEYPHIVLPLGFGEDLHRRSSPTCICNLGRNELVERCEEIEGEYSSLRGQVTLDSVEDD
jgi:hypothetical protein